MLKLLKKKSVLASVFITGAVILIYAIFGNNNPVTSAVKTVFSPVLTITSEISDSVGNFKDYLIDVSVYKEENNRLNNEINKMKTKNRDVSELTSENERLKELLDLKSSLNYETKAALVISYEPNNWYDTIVVNKGSNDGVEVGDAVICQNGAVGKVTDTGIGWSKISSLLNDENAVGVRIIRTGELAVVEGDLELSKEQFCKMSFFDKGIDMMMGDILETTGGAGIYPPNVIVGTVAKIQADDDGREYAVVEPAVDFESLYEVLIITGER